MYPSPLNVEVSCVCVSFPSPRPAAVHGHRCLRLGLRFLPRPSYRPLDGKGRQVADPPQPDEDKLTERSDGIDAPMPAPTPTRPTRHPWITWAASLLFHPAALATLFA